MSIGTDSKRRIVDHLKRRASATVAELTDHLGITSTAVRQHLDDLQATGLVERLDAVNTGGRGRPRMPWALTDLATDLFPDRHADLTVELITAIRESVGEEGLDAVIANRAGKQRTAYAEAVSRAGTTLEASVTALADIRSAEGYIADSEAEGDGSFTLTEHHCPVGTAAGTCNQLCRDELQVFRDVLGPDVEVQRTSHLLSGDSRCSYRITPVPVSLS